MRRAFTIIEVMFAASVPLIIVAIALHNILESKKLADAKRTDAVTIDSSQLKVHEWTDEKTGKRYLVFDRYNGGLFVIEAPLIVEKK